MRQKAIRLVVEDALPEDLRGQLGDLDSNGLNDMLAELARRHPEQYAAVSKRLADIGRNASYWQGETLTLADAKPVVETQKMLTAMDAEIEKARNDLKHDPEEFAKERSAIWNKYSSRIQKETLAAALANGNSLGFSVASKARGKPGQLQAMLSTPGLYTSTGGKEIPMFIRGGFNRGLRPAEYLAGTYGTRESIVTIKRATAKGGYLGKLLAQVTTPLIVSEEDCGIDNGIDLDIGDASLRHRVLARDTAGMPAGTILDRDAINRLRKDKKLEAVVVRSPLTCQAPYGVCAKCAGADSRNQLPATGTSVGITAANAIGEPIAQGALSSKHSAGQSAGAKKEYSGFDVINRFVQTPETFEDRAIVAEEDGKVTRIEPAAQGGTYVYVNDAPHYILPGYPVQVRAGDTVEAGDPLADGLIDPSDIVRLRGLGEGRRYYAERFQQLLKDSDIPADRRNTELLARASLDHVVVDDDQGLDGILPDDVVSYNTVRRLYEIPETAKAVKPTDAVGQYLQKDALHYTIGTRITPKIAERLAKRGFDEITASPDQPFFHPEMVRLQSSTHNNPDWLASQHTSYLRRQMADDAARGRTTNIAENPHFAPRLAVGKDFGRKVRETGKF